VAVLSVDSLKVSFHLRNKVTHAVRGISFDVHDGEILGIVGESGSGKSVSVLSLLRLLPEPPARIEGNALFRGTNLLQSDQATIRSIRGNQISMVFQDPGTSLNPYMRISDQLIEPLLMHRNMKKPDALNVAVQLLQEVGIDNALERITAYPHEFSGGMQQRVMIAMALVTQPEILIADEPTTALDVTIQAQILRLLKNLQKKHGMSIIFITHDLGVVAQLCDRVVVMYAGCLLESAATHDLYKTTSHPYTKALIESLPSVHRSKETLKTIPGTPPDLATQLKGCPFAPRCSFTAPQCETDTIHLAEVHPGHYSACIRYTQGDIRL